MKKTFAYFVALSVATSLAVGLTGCAPANNIVAGSEITIGELAAFNNLNADVASNPASQLANADVANLTNASFYHTDANGQLVANTKFGTVTVVSQKPFTVKYSLSNDAKWSDGTSVDAYDLLLSWLAASDPTSAGFKSVRSASGLQFATTTPKISNSDKDLTVKFEQPVTDYETALTVSVPAHLVAQAAFGGDNLSASDAKKKIDTVNASDLTALATAYNTAFTISGNLSDAQKVTSGAYTVSDFANSTLTLKANPNFVTGPSTKVETVKVALFNSTEDELAALNAGTIDVVAPAESATTRSSDILSAVSALASKGYTSNVLASSQVEQVLLNFGKKSFFNAAAHNGNSDKATTLQDAFLKSVPKAKMVAAAAYDIATQQSDSFVYPATSQNYQAVTQSNGSVAFRIQEAELGRQEVQSTNPVGGRYAVRVLFDASNPRAQVEFGLLDEKAALVGFKLNNISTTSIASVLKSGEYDVLITDQPLLSFTEDAAGGLLARGATGYSDATALSLWSKIATSGDSKATQYQKLDAQLFKSHFGLPLYQIPSIVVHNNRVASFVSAPFGGSATWGYWNWSVAKSSK